MADSLINRRLNGYYIETLLGRGGMARVYRGIDIHLQRYVAIKVIDAPYRNDPNHARRFEREARVIAQLGQHLNVVKVYHYGEDQGYLFMAMQYIEGADLGAVMRTYRQDGEFMPHEEILRLTRDICNALDYIHSRGVIHRDLKPSNIMVDPQGHAILTDFGLALLTQTGTLGEAFGSPHYIAPEQVVSSAQAVRQSDLYSLGVVLFELFTNKLPFDADSAVNLAMLHMQTPPPAPRSFRPDLSTGIEAVILKALSKSPENRQRSGQELFAELERAVQGAYPHAAPPPTLAHQTLPAHVRRQARPLPPPTLPSLENLPAPEPLKPAERPAAPPPTYPDPMVIPVTSRRLQRSCLSRLVAPVIVLLAAAVLCAGAALAFNNLPGLGPAGSATDQPGQIPPFATATAPHEATPSSTADPTNTPVWTDTPVVTDTPEPSPTPPGPVFELRLTKHASTFLAITNTGEDNFPLPPLRIGRGADAIPGIVWGIHDLEPGDCVGAFRLVKKPKLPEDLNCRLLGMIEGHPQVRLWDGNFDVFYDEKKVGECKQKDDVCVVLIPIR